MYGKGLSHLRTQLHGACGRRDGLGDGHDVLGRASGGFPAPTIRHTRSPHALGEHHTWVIDVTIHNAQLQPCLSSPSSGGVVRVVQAAKVSTWAELLAGTAECVFRLICFSMRDLGLVPLPLSETQPQRELHSWEQRRNTVDGVLGPCMQATA